MEFRVAMGLGFVIILIVGYIAFSRMRMRGSI